MKIVVCGSDGDAWWEIRSNGDKIIATSFNTYSKLSDAKRGANRFEDRMFNAYAWADEGNTPDGCMLPVEMDK